MSSQFGSIFRISTWGESHGVSVGVVIDGCPPRIPLTVEMIQAALDRRRPGQSDIVSTRNESDTAEILSGVLNGLTLGTPIAIQVRNTDHRSAAYDEVARAYRPSHADYTYDAKYGIRAHAGGGRASARETIGRVAAGAVAQAVLQSFLPDLDVIAWVESVGEIQAERDAQGVTHALVASTPMRTSCPTVADTMMRYIKEIRAQGDSIGGTIRAIVRNAPAGLGDPVFDKLSATLAHAMFSIPAVKGFEIGSGFAGAKMRGSENNDAFYNDAGIVRTRTNHSGGIQGGISNGEPISLTIAFKPTATIMIEQETVNTQHNPCTITGKGRHDACVLPRAVPIVEAMAWLALADHFLSHRAQVGYP